MNLLLIVDPNKTYQQAVQIAYEKAMQNGGVDPLTEQICEWVRNCPPPAAEYHERDMSSFFGQTADGCIIGLGTSGYDIYEQAKLDAKRGFAEGIAQGLREELEKFKDRLKSECPDASTADLTFIVDENSEISIFSPAGLLADNYRVLFSRLANQDNAFKALAVDYVMTLASLVNRTTDGLSADYATYFSLSK